MINRLKLLVIEDNPGDALLTRSLLEGTRVEIDSFHVIETLSQAEAYAGTDKVDLILLDLNIPDSNGIETFDVISSLFPDVPIIILSVLRESEVANEALSHGAQDFLIKGEFDELLLERAIRYSIERVDSLRKLRQSEERYRQLFNLNPQPMYAFDEETLEFFLVNKATIDNYGYSREEFMKMKLTDIRPASELPLMYRQLEEQRTSTTSMVSGTWIHQRKDGSLIEVNIMSMRLEVDNRIARLVVVEDVTEKRKTMNHLLMLESVITNINDAILITEAEPIKGDGPKILYANKAFENMTGYTLEEIRGLTPRILQGPETDRSELDRIHDSMSKWESADAEVINYRKDGSTFWSHFSVVPVADENGWFTYWISVQRNISGRKHAETEQRLLTQELLQQNRDLQQFSFIISHNFRAPIANMQGLLNLLDTNNYSDESKVIIENLNTTVNQLDGTLNDLVKVVLLKSFANLDSERITFDDIIFSTKLSLKHDLADHSIQLYTSFDKAPSVYTNRVALDSIFLHLISNAIKYRSPLRDLVINVSTHTDSEYTIITIKDNGLGMDVDRYRDRIFGMHQRFHSHKEGRGMGLYMTNHQVMALGGHIEVSGKENEGLEFRIFLKEKMGNRK